jgi:hypothetical protein
VSDSVASGSCHGSPAPHSAQDHLASDHDDASGQPGRRPRLCSVTRVEAHEGDRRRPWPRAMPCRTSCKTARHIVSELALGPGCPTQHRTRQPDPLGTLPVPTPTKWAGPSNLILDGYRRSMLEGMCGPYVSVAERGELIGLYNATAVGEELTPSCNVAPTSQGTGWSPTAPRTTARWSGRFGR